MKSVKLTLENVFHLVTVFAHARAFAPPNQSKRLDSFQTAPLQPSFLSVLFVLESFTVRSLLLAKTTTGMIANFFDMEDCRLFMYFYLYI